jgi:DNA invertase Pin-like site-specific DNA recombinase
VVEVVGYVRVSTGEQGASGASLEAQESAIRLECERRGWHLVTLEKDVLSGRTLRRPGLQRALKACEKGDAAAIVVAKLDRLSRSVADFSRLIEEARGRFDVVVLDAGVDTTSPHGKAMVQMISVFAELERELIGQRTKDALAIKRAQGVRLGRPPSIPASVLARIKSLRTRGWSYARIAENLNCDGVATAHGGRQWYPATVRAAFVMGHRA